MHNVGESVGNRSYGILEMGMLTSAIMSLHLRSQAEGVVVPVSLCFHPLLLQVICPPCPGQDDWEKGSRRWIGRVGVAPIINAPGREEMQNCVSARLKIDF